MYSIVALKIKGKPLVGLDSISVHSQQELSHRDEIRYPRQQTCSSNRLPLLPSWVRRLARWDMNLTTCSRKPAPAVKPHQLSQRMFPDFVGQLSQLTNMSRYWLPTIRPSQSFSIHQQERPSQTETQSQIQALFSYHVLNGTYPNYPICRILPQQHCSLHNSPTSLEVRSS